jgi:phosphatidylglycerophosphate synthase
MATIPKRQALTGAVYYRKILTFLEKKFRLPTINPSWFQVVGLLMSVYYLFLFAIPIKIFFIAIILLLDWFDGAAARQQNKKSLEGWMIDVMIDRLSEGFIFFAEIGSTIGLVFFILWIANVALSIYSVKTGKHILLALRFAYIFVLAYQYFI